MRRAERVTEGPLARMARTTHLANWPTGHPNGQLIDPPVRFTRLSGGTKLAMSVWSTFYGPLSTFTWPTAPATLNCNYSVWLPPKNWPAQLIKKFAAQ